MHCCLLFYHITFDTTVLCFLGIIDMHFFPITTTSSAEVADCVKSTVEQLHAEFSHDVRPPCKLLCYVVSAGYSRVQNNATCKNSSTALLLNFAFSNSHFFVFNQFLMMLLFSLT